MNAYGQTLTYYPSIRFDLYLDNTLVEGFRSKPDSWTYSQLNNNANRIYSDTSLYTTNDTVWMGPDFHMVLQVQLIFISQQQDLKILLFID